MLDYLGLNSILSDELIHMYGLLLANAVQVKLVHAQGREAAGRTGCSGQWLGTQYPPATI